MLMILSVLLIVTDTLLIVLEILFLKDMHNRKAEDEKSGMCDVEIVSDNVREKISKMKKEVGVGCSQEDLAQMRAEARRKRWEEQR